MTDCNRKPRLRYLTLTCVLALMLALVGGTGLAEAKKASLKVSVVPSQVKVNGPFKIKASGFAGKFDTLEIFATSAPCAKTDAVEKTQHHPYPSAVTPHKNFTAQQSFKGTAQPETAHACVYLFKASKPGAANQLHKSKKIKITA